MTAAQLASQLLNFNSLGFEVIVETKFKTGYAEGTIYHNKIDKLEVFKGKIIIKLGGYEVVGGW